MHGHAFTQAQQPYLQDIRSAIFGSAEDNNHQSNKGGPKWQISAGERPANDVRN